MAEIEDDAAVPGQIALLKAQMETLQHSFANGLASLASRLEQMQTVSQQRPSNRRSSVSSSSSASTDEHIDPSSPNAFDEVQNPELKLLYKLLQESN